MEVSNSTGRLVSMSAGIVVQGEEKKMSRKFERI